MSKKGTRESEILKMLKKQYLTSNELSEALGVDPRTIRRDLVDLKNMGRVVREGHAYRIIKTDAIRPSKEGNVCVELTPDEIHSLITVYSMMKSTDLIAGLGPITSILSQIKKCDEKLTLSDSSKKKTDIFKSIDHAINANDFLTMTYKNARGVKSSRIIKPYRFFLIGDILYLCAWSGHRKLLDAKIQEREQLIENGDSGLRTFAFRRIEEVKNPPRRFRDIHEAKCSGKEIQEYIECQYNAYPIKRNQSVMLTASLNLENYLILHPIHPKQIIVPYNGKYLHVSFRGDITKPLISAILRLGRDAAVVSPENLKQSIKEELTAMLKKYK